MHAPLALGYTQLHIRSIKPGHHEIIIRQPKPEKIEWYFELWASFKISVPAWIDYHLKLEISTNSPNLWIIKNDLQNEKNGVPLVLLLMQGLQTPPL